MGIVLLCLLGVPLAGVVRAVFRRFGVLGFGIAWLTFVATAALLLMVLRLDLLLSLALAAALPFLVLWVLGRAGVLLGD